MGSHQQWQCSVPTSVNLSGFISKLVVTCGLSLLLLRVLSPRVSLQVLHFSTINQLFRIIDPEILDEELRWDVLLLNFPTHTTLYTVVWKPATGFDLLWRLVDLSHCKYKVWPTTSTLLAFGNFLLWSKSQKYQNEHRGEMCKESGEEKSWQI